MAICTSAVDARRPPILLTFEGGAKAHFRPKTKVSNYLRPPTTIQIVTRLARRSKVHFAGAPAESSESSRDSWVVELQPGAAALFVRGEQRCRYRLLPECLGTSVLVIHAKVPSSDVLHSTVTLLSLKGK